MAALRSFLAFCAVSVLQHAVSAVRLEPDDNVKCVVVGPNDMKAWWPVKRSNCMATCTMVVDKGDRKAESQHMFQFASHFETKLTGETCSCSAAGEHYVSYNAAQKRDKDNCRNSGSDARYTCWTEYKKAVSTETVMQGKMAIATVTLNQMRDATFHVVTECKADACGNECRGVELPQKLAVWGEDTRLTIRKVLVDGADAHNDVAKLVQSLTEDEKIFVEIDEDGDMELDPEELGSFYDEDQAIIQEVLNEVLPGGMDKLTFEYFPSWTRAIRNSKERRVSEASSGDGNGGSAGVALVPQWRPKALACMLGDEEVDASECASCTHPTSNTCA